MYVYRNILNTIMPATQKAMPSPFPPRSKPTGPQHPLTRNAELTQRNAGIRHREYTSLNKEKVISAANWQKSHINGCSTYLPITFENPNSTRASVVTVLAQ